MHGRVGWHCGRSGAVRRELLATKYSVKPLTAVNKGLYRFNNPTVPIRPMVVVQTQLFVSVSSRRASRTDFQGARELCCQTAFFRHHSGRGVLFRLLRGLKPRLLTE